MTENAADLYVKEWDDNITPYVLEKHASSSYCWLPRFCVDTSSGTQPGAPGHMERETVKAQINKHREPEVATPYDLES